MTSLMDLIIYDYFIDKDYGTDLFYEKCYISFIFMKLYHIISYTVCYQNTFKFNNIIVII